MGDIELLKEMGERIYSRRKSMRLTQEELAEKMGVSTQMISNLELGKKAIRPENLVKICAVLDISADYILTGKISNLSIDNISNMLLRLDVNELMLIKSFVEYMNSNK